MPAVDVSSTCSSSGPGRPEPPPRSRLTRAGLDVVLVDKATFPRDKTCGDGLTTGALRLLRRLGVELPQLEIAAPVTEAVIVDPSGRRVSLPLPTDPVGPRSTRRSRRGATSTPRSSRHTRALGVAVREGTALSGARAATRPGSRRRSSDRRHQSRRAGPLRGRRRRSLLGRAPPARPRPRRPTSVRGTRRASTFAASTTPDCGCCSSATCCPATRGCSRCRAGAPTSGFGVLRD